MLTWQQIHELEMREAYPEAIDALEALLASAPDDAEAVIRLGFNLWYGVEQEPRMEKNLPVEKYAARFMELLHLYEARLQDNADFCWAYGLGLSMFGYMFPGATKEQGKRLLDRARALDPFWKNLSSTNMSRLKGRGIFEHYYNVQ